MSNVMNVELGFRFTVLNHSITVVVFFPLVDICCYYSGFVDSV